MNDQPHKEPKSIAPEPENETDDFADMALGGVRSASDLITEKLGLERIEGFSVIRFFSQVFRKHDPNEVENLFTVGSSLTTPSLHPHMAVLPNPWVFFRVFLSSLVVYVLFHYGATHFENPLVIPALIFVGSFAIPFATLIFFFEINTPRNVSIVRLIQLVILGGSFSILLSLLLFKMTPLLGILGAPSAGIVEEIGKLCTVLATMRLIPMDRYPFRLNALLFGAAVGTGFAAFESAGYALLSSFSLLGLMSGQVVDVSKMTSIITLRGVMSPFAHIVWTAIATSAYWIARKEHDGMFSTILSRKFLTLFSVPVVLHFIWNMNWTGPFWIKYWILAFIAWIVVLSLVQSGLKEIGNAARRFHPSMPKT